MIETNEDARLQAEADRGRQATELLNHPMYREAFSHYRERLAQEWANSPARDQEGREKLWLMLKTAAAVERHLAELMETGKLASLQLDQRTTLKDRARNLWAEVNPW